MQDWGNLRVVKHTQNLHGDKSIGPTIPTSNVSICKSYVRQIYLALSADKKMIKYDGMTWCVWDIYIYIIKLTNLWYMYAKSIMNMCMIVAYRSLQIRHTVYGLRVCHKSGQHQCICLGGSQTMCARVSIQNTRAIKFFWLLVRPAINSVLQP